jgi:hypothetical protein
MIACVVPRRTNDRQTSRAVGRGGLGLPNPQRLRIASRGSRTQRLERFDDLPPATRSMASSNRDFGMASSNRDFGRAECARFRGLPAFDLFLRADGH